MRKRYFHIFAALFVGTLLLISCKKNLNGNFFNSTKITEYKLDNYTGEVDFKLPESYDIDDSLVHVFPIYSKAENETDSTKIWAIYIGDVKKIAKPSGRATSVILYLHGNKDHMDFYWPRAKLLANINGKNKVGVMMIDYRGYGLSEGESSEINMYADADAALKWLKNKGLRYPNLGVYGFSIGSGPACEISYKRYAIENYRLALEAPFASVATMVGDGSGLNIDPLFYTDYKFDNVSKVKRIQAPFLWLHGTKDKYLDIKTHGEVLFNSYEGTVGIANRVEGASHSNVPFMMGLQTYCDTLANFYLKH